MHDTERADFDLTTGEHCMFQILLLTTKAPLLLHFKAMVATSESKKGSVETGSYCIMTTSI